MIDILSLKLENISAETATEAGFLIKLSNSGFETLAAFNENNYDIIPIGNDIRRLYLSNLLSNEKICESDSYLYLSVERDIKSLFIERITDTNSPDSIFLLLFSKIKENYTKENITTIRKYIKEINKQIRESLNQDNIAEDITRDSSVYGILQGEWFSRNRSLIFSSLLNAFNDLLFVLDDNGYILAVSRAGAISMDYSDLDMR
ncbi:MAG TPA: hypothetical protein VI230_03620, partial [Ignavibacteriaceae bacterium]